MSPKQSNPKNETEPSALSEAQEAFIENIKLSLSDFALLEVNELARLKGIQVARLCSQNIETWVESDEFQELKERVRRRKLEWKEGLTD